MRRRVITYLGRHHWGILATFIALGGTAYASTQLPRDSVGTKQLKQGAVTLGKISGGAQGALHRGPAGGDLTGSFPNPTIKAGAVTASRLAPPPAPIVAQLNLGFATGFATGWIEYGPPYSSVTYYRDNQGVVHLDGVARSEDNFGPWIGNPRPNQCGASYIFTLPASYRPAAVEDFAVDSNGGHAQVWVEPNGFVDCRSGQGDKGVSLAGITFRAGG